ncbi:MAG TPA: hypothetical protein VGO25_00910, partial [Rhodanobacteraceae bacterium]|nr:hypothetical protein [Rhodanobacteraceae bacterium]
LSCDIVFVSRRSAPKSNAPDAADASNATRRSRRLSRAFGKREVRRRDTDTHDALETLRELSGLRPGNSR